MQLSGINECGLRSERSRSKMIHEMVSNNCSFVSEEDESKARY